ncbi:MAG: class I SAM-dependent methyltransferase [Longimicrobiaceae bacterium]
MTPGEGTAAPSQEAAAAAEGPGYRRYDWKTRLLDGLLARFGDRDVEVLDLGSGTSKDWVEVLPRYPRVRYTGVEYREGALARARELLAGIPRVELASGFGEEVQASFAGRFDLTLSLSVLEHVKHLRAFLRSSARATRPGGWIVHRYDLGHALHSRPYERTKVFLCRRAPWAMPARHFTTHPRLGEVTRTLEEAGVEIRDVAYSQLTGLKQMMNRIDWSEPGAAGVSRPLLELDERLARYMAARRPAREMERLFPSITVTGVKR